MIGFHESIYGVWTCNSKIQFANVFGELLVLVGFASEKPWAESCMCVFGLFFRMSQAKTWSRKMSSPGIEPGLSRPQRDVLTTRRWGLNTDKQKQAFDQCKNLNFQGGRNEIIAFNMITTGLLQWCSLCGLESHSRRICNPAFITEAFFSTLLSHRL